MQFHFDQNFLNSYDIGEDYWTSQRRTFSCFSLNLRTIVIFCLEEYMFGNKHELALVEFLLMNASVLEKMVISNDYPFHVPNKTDHLLKMARETL